MNNYFVGICLHVLFPIAYGFFILFFMRKLDREKIINLPNALVLLVLFHVGLLLFTVLIFVYWRWSALMQLVYLYVLFISPWVMLIALIVSFVKRKTSLYHKIIFYLTIFYLFCIFLLNITST